VDNFEATKDNIKVLQECCASLELMKARFIDDPLEIEVNIEQIMDTPRAFQFRIQKVCKREAGRFQKATTHVAVETCNDFFMVLRRLGYAEGLPYKIPKQLKKSVIGTGIINNLSFGQIFARGSTELIEAEIALYRNSIKAVQRLAGLPDAMRALESTIRIVAKTRGSMLAQSIMDSAFANIENTISLAFANNIAPAYMLRNLSYGLTALEKSANKINLAFIKNVNVKKMDFALAQREAINSYVTAQNYRNYSIARTEAATAINDGALLTYRQSNIDKVVFTAGPNACDICLEVNGTIMSVETAEGMIPLHCNGMCTWTPVVGSMEDVGRILEEPSEPADVTLPLVGLALLGVLPELDLAFGNDYTKYSKDSLEYFYLMPLNSKNTDPYRDGIDYSTGDVKGFLISNDDNRITSAYVLSQAMGFGRVPQTVKREDGKVFSRLIPSVKSAVDYFYKNKDIVRERRLAQLKQLIILYFLLDKMDSKFFATMEVDSGGNFWGVNNFTVDKPITKSKSIINYSTLPKLLVSQLKKSRWTQSEVNAVVALSNNWESVKETLIAYDGVNVLEFIDEIKRRIDILIQCMIFGKSVENTIIEIKGSALWPKI